jgi:hypothetical protein
MKVESLVHVLSDSIFAVRSNISAGLLFCICCPLDGRIVHTIWRPLELAHRPLIRLPETGGVIWQNQAHWRTW